MAGWNTCEGRAVYLPQENVDTDQLIPARFMSTPRSQGYGDYLLHDLRRDADGALLPDFPLNASPDASILLAGRNFGTGSSREAAVYALVDAGFRAVIAPGFGDIFASNAVNNGLLPARLGTAQIKKLVAALAEKQAKIRIDLTTCEIVAETLTVQFGLDDMWRTKLIKGWDDIDLTLQHAGEIARYRAERIDLRWILPVDRVD